MAGKGTGAIDSRIVADRLIKGTTLPSPRLALLSNDRSPLSS